MCVCVSGGRGDLVVVVEIVVVVVLVVIVVVKYTSGERSSLDSVY